MHSLLLGGGADTEAWPKLVYTLIAMRRVFKRSWTGTAFKAIALFFVYMVVFGMTVGAVFVYPALQL